jgi:hypothetical protein
MSAATSGSSGFMLSICVFAERSKTRNIDRFRIVEMSWWLDSSVIVPATMSLFLEDGDDIWLFAIR